MNIQAFLIICFVAQTLYPAAHQHKRKPHEIISQQAADFSLIKPYQATVILTSGNQYKALPKQIADMSYYLRNATTNSNVISLDFEERSLKKSFNLKTIASLLTQAKKTLVAKPVSSSGSYVELAHKEPLASLKHFKSLLKLFIACDFLQIDCYHIPTDDTYETVLKGANEQLILKAIALRIAQLELKRISLKDTFTTLDSYCKKINYNFVEFIWPYIQAQGFLNTKCKHVYMHHTPFGISVRDLLVHDALASNLVDYKLHEDRRRFRYLLRLTNSRLNSLDGIQNTDEWVANFLFHQYKLSSNAPLMNPPLEWFHLNLQNNEFTTIPTLHLPALKSLDLRNNNITTLPDNLNNFPVLRKLDLRGNPITYIPEILKRRWLFIVWDGPKE